MDDVEVQVLPEGQKEGEDNKPDRVVGERHERRPAVAVGPQHKDFVEGPDRAAADHRPEHVVLDLVFEEERLAVGARPAGIVLEAGALHATPVEDAVQSGAHDGQHHIVADEHRPDPLDTQLAEGGRVVGARLEVGPGQVTQTVVERSAERPEKTWETKEEPGQLA